MFCLCARVDSSFTAWQPAMCTGQTYTYTEHFPLHVRVFPSLCRSWYGTGIVYFGYVAVKNGMFCICADRTSRELSYQDNTISFSPRQKSRCLMARTCSSVFCHWLTSKSDLTVKLKCTAVQKQWIHPSTSHLSPTNLWNKRFSRSGEAEDGNHCGSSALHHPANLISLYPLLPHLLEI